MSNIDKGLRRAFAGIVALILTLGVAIAAFTPQLAYAGEDAVRAVGDGVFKINLSYTYKFTDSEGQALRDEYGNVTDIEMKNVSRGSAFLINEDTVLTCYHCVMLSDEEIATLKGLGVNTNKFLKSFKYTVTVSGDVEIPCKLVNQSKEEDWAILKLDQTVGGTTPLMLRDSSTVQAADSVWTVGFPGNSEAGQVINTYRPDDVTIRNGRVNKPESIMQFGLLCDSPLSYMVGEPVYFNYYVNGYFLQTDCAISGGDSGGPMVDDNGYVVGINEGSGDYYYGVAIDEVTKVLDRLQIEYTPAPGPFGNGGGNGGGTEGGTTPTTEGTEGGLSLKNLTELSSAITAAETLAASGTDVYTPESLSALNAAIDEAKTASALTVAEDDDEAAVAEKQGQIDSALEKLKTAQAGLQKQPENKGINPAVIGAIAAAVIAAVAALVFALTRKKKPEPVAAPTPAPAAAPAPTPTPAPANVQAQPAAIVEDEPGTTVLTDDDPATTVLAEEVDGGSLTRMSTNERIDINRSEITLGRERRSVDYCLEGNSNIGRVHARILVRDGVVYIVDNNSTNGTFVNNAKLRPGLEQQLKSGDIVRLADEKFRYNK